MSAPTHVSSAGVHVLDWPDVHIRVRIDRLRNERENLTGEITVKTTNPGVAQHLHQARFNLTSTTARKTLAKALQERLDLAWDDMIEQACVMVLAKHREGEPVIRVGNLPPREALKYRVSPLLLNNQPTLAFGPGGTGKSYFALYLAVLIGGSWQHNGLLAEPGKVLVLDYETDQYEVDERIKAIVKGLDVETSPEIYYRFCAGALAHEIEDIQAFVTEHQIDVVIVDPLGGAVGADMNDSEPILDYFRSLRALRTITGLSVTSLSIDHTNKEGKLFGSEYKYHRARSVFEAKKQQDSWANFLDFGLYHRKMNNGKLLPPRGYRLEFSTESVTFTEKDVMAVPDFAATAPRWQQAAKVLKNGSMTDEDLAKYLETTITVIRAELGRRKDVFVRPTDGTWGLLQHG